MSNQSIVINEQLAQIIKENLTNENLIGQGGDGKIYRLIYYNIDAIAKVPITDNNNKSIKSEIVIYSYLCKRFNQCICSDNIVQMLGYNMDNFILILEYFDGSDLLNYLEYPISDISFYTHRLLPRDKSYKLNFNGIKILEKIFEVSGLESIIMSLFVKIYDGLLCLHSNKIIHRDFELKNILVNNNGKVGISDFGLSRIIERSKTFSDVSQLIEGFKYDTDKIGPLMGDFLDISNQIPYQYRLDYGPIDNTTILNAISDNKLKDFFLLSISFNDIISFVSFIHYINMNTDLESGEDLINEITNYYNDIIESEVNVSEFSFSYISKNDTDNIIKLIYNPMNPNDKTSNIILYFRSIIKSILDIIGNSHSLDSTNIYDNLHIIFDGDYDTAVSLINEQIRYGFLLKHYKIFSESFQ